MDIDEFFDFDDKSKTEINQREPQEEKSDSEAIVNTEKEPEKPKKVEMEFAPSNFQIGEDITDIFLLDVKYESEKNLAQCIFYHEPSRSIYKWDDNTGHQPYFLTTMEKDNIEKVDEIANSREFVKIEEVDKFVTLDNRNRKFRKVVGTNPLAIGGTQRSFRNFTTTAYEADIRYHLNYVTDMKLTPGTYYSVENGKLVAKDFDIDKAVSEELEAAFANEGQEAIDMLDEYMPKLFQEFPDILRCAFDIEVDSERNKLPNPLSPVNSIISIATADSEGRKKCWVLKRPEVDQDVDIDYAQIKLFETEIELLIDFFEEINKYPIVISYNGDNFDVPYIYNRAKKIGIDESTIPIKLKRNDTEFTNSVHLDLYKFFRQAAIRLYAFGGKYERSSLDELSQVLLNEGKVEHPDEWINEMDLNNLVKYNVKDAELTLRLTQFDDNISLNLMIILMRISKIPLYDFSRTAVSRWLHMWVLYEHRKRNYLVPTKEDISFHKGGAAASSAIIDGKKFQGAIVLDPIPGIWWDVHVLDFASLYPSIIKTRNLSYETINCEHEECKINIVPEVNHWVCTKKKGIFSILLGFVRDTRVNWFKPRSSDERLDEKERRKNDIIQSSLKVLINAGYGVLGSENFDFYCPPVAESTTAYARNAITITQDYIEKELDRRVLYGDTDSVFVYQPNTENIEKIKKWSIDSIGIELGIDYEFRYVVFSNLKKNYFGITKYNGVIVKGLQGKKSNTPNLIRNTFTNVLNILRDVKQENDIEPAKDKVFNEIQNMVFRIKNKDFEIEDVSFRTVLSKSIKEYATWSTSVQAVAQLIRKGVHTLDEIEQGFAVEYVKVADPTSIAIPAGFALPEGEVKKASVVPIQVVSKDEIDSKPLLDISKSTFSLILDSFDLSWDRILGIQALDDYF